MKLSLIFITAITVCYVVTASASADKQQSVKPQTSSGAAGASSSNKLKNGKTSTGKVTPKPMKNVKGKEADKPTVINRKIGPVTIRDEPHNAGLSSRQEKFGACKRGLICGKKGWEWMDMDLLTSGIAAWCFQLENMAVLSYMAQFSAQVNNLKLVAGRAGMLASKLAIILFMKTDKNKRKNYRNHSDENVFFDFLRSS